MGQGTERNQASLEPPNRPGAFGSIRKDGSARAEGHPTPCMYLVTERWTLEGSMSRGAVYESLSFVKWHKHREKLISEW